VTALSRLSVCSSARSRLRRLPSMTRFWGSLFQVFRLRHCLRLLCILQRGNNQPARSRGHIPSKRQERNREIKQSPLDMRGETWSGSLRQRNTTSERLGILVDCTDTHRCIGDQSIEAVKGTGIDMQLGGNTSLHQSHG